MAVVLSSARLKRGIGADRAGCHSAVKTTMIYIHVPTTPLRAFVVRWTGFESIHRGGLMRIRVSCRDKPHGREYTIAGKGVNRFSTRNLQACYADKRPGIRSLSGSAYTLLGNSCI